jgi:CHAD domain-containing protein
MKVPLSARQSELAAAGGAMEMKPALAHPSLTPRMRLSTSVTASELALAELRRLLAAWHAHEPGARVGHDAEELHQLRVTARRIDATLALFKRQLPALVHARKTTKAVLRTLGAARDLDVQLANLGQYCAGLPEPERRAAEPLKARLELERTRARGRMLRALDSEPTRRWLEALTLATTEPAAGDGADAVSAMVVMPERVRRRFRKLRTAVQRLRPKSSMEAYHDVRRRAKQLRYAIESGAAMFGKPADDTLKALRRLQEKLGRQQDAYMAKVRLTALAADQASGLPSETLFLMGRLAEHHSYVTTQARENLTRSWRKVRGRRWKALRTRLAELSERAHTVAGLPAAVDAAPPSLFPMHPEAAAEAAVLTPSAQRAPVQELRPFRQ